MFEVLGHFGSRWEFHRKHWVSVGKCTQLGCSTQSKHNTHLKTSNTCQLPLSHHLVQTVLTPLPLTQSLCRVKYVSTAIPGDSEG